MLHLDPTLPDSSDSESSAPSLRHKASFRSALDAQSIASTTDQSFVSAQESIETMSSAVSFHSTPSTVNIHAENQPDVSEVSAVSSASQYSQDSAKRDDKDAEDAASALPDVKVGEEKQKGEAQANDVRASDKPQPSLPKNSNSAESSPANTVVDSIFDSTQVSYNGSPSTEFNSVVSAATTPKQSPAQSSTPRKRNASTNSNTSTIRASMTKKLPAAPPKRERRRVVSSPSSNSDVNFRRLSNDTSSTKPSSSSRPPSRLILPSEFVKLRKDAPGSVSTASAVSETTKYAPSGTTSAVSANKLPRAKELSLRARSSTVTGAFQSRNPSVKTPTTKIDEMLPSDALGIERSMLSVSVTSGAAEKLARSNRSVIGKRKSVSWSGARSKQYSQMCKPMITLGLNSHFKPPQKLDPHSVLVRGRCCPNTQSGLNLTQRLSAHHGFRQLRCLDAHARH